MDDLFEALAHPYRRRLLLDLFETDPPTVSTLDGDTETLHEVDLLHNHLPRLEESGLIEWRRSNETIAPGPRFPDIEPILAWLRESDLDRANPKTASG